jgi:hypothetical protein
MTEEQVVANIKSRSPQLRKKRQLEKEDAEDVCEATALGARYSRPRPRAKNNTVCKVTACECCLEKRHLQNRPLLAEILLAEDTVRKDAVCKILSLAALLDD